MVSRGPVSEPKQPKDSGQYYPERWMSDGSAYEFTTRKTDQPPQDLVTDFHRITKSVNLQGTLGLYHIEADRDAPPVTGDEGSLSRAEGKGGFSGCIRLCWAWHEVDEIKDGIRRLADTIQNIRQRIKKGEDLGGQMAIGIR